MLRVSYRPGVPTVPPGGSQPCQLGCHDNAMALVHAGPVPRHIREDLLINMVIGRPPSGRAGSCAASAMDRVVGRS